MGKQHRVSSRSFAHSANGVFEGSISDIETGGNSDVSLLVDYGIANLVQRGEVHTRQPG